MEKEFYIELIYKSLSDELTSEEQNQLNQWLSASEENQKEANVITETWELSSNFTKDFDVDLDKDFAQLQNKIQSNFNDVELDKKEAIVKTMPTASTKSTSWWKPLSVAAAVLLLAGAFFILNNNQSGAQILVLETGEGEEKEVQLADKSKVWLNENSKLTYPSQMDGDYRKVTLEGEAFFDITKNPQKQFIITTRDSEVKVLGTSFQVSAYDVNQTEVVVKTGKVSLGKKNEVNPLVLVAKEIGIHNYQTGKYAKGRAQDFNAISWQSEVLDFDDTSLAKVLYDVGKHFDIELILANKSLSNCPFGSIFNSPKQQKTLEAICEVFELKLVPINETTFRLEGGKCL